MPDVMMSDAPAQALNQVSMQIAPLRAALAQVAAAVERNCDIAALSTMWLKANADSQTVTLIGTDLDMEIRRRIPARVDADLSVLIDPHTLRNFLSTMPKLADVQMQVTGTAVTVTLLRTTAQMDSRLFVDDFPAFKPPQGEWQTVDAQTLTGALSRVTHCAEPQGIRYYLEGIHLHARKQGGIVAVATDGHRLMAVDLANIQADVGGKGGIIVPRGSLAAIQALLLGRDKVEWLLTSDKKHLALRSLDGEAQVITKLIDGTFPDYRANSVIPQTLKHIIPVQIGALRQAIRTVISIAPRKEKSPAVKLGAEDNSLCVAYWHPDVGHCRAQFDLPDQPWPLNICFNGRYLLEALDALGSSDQIVRFGINDKDRQVVLQVDADVIYALMPMWV